MKQNNCPVCGRQLDFGEACYHDESLKRRLINKWLDLKGPQHPFVDKGRIELDIIRVESILWFRYGYDIALTKTSIH